MRAGSIEIQKNAPLSFLCSQAQKIMESSEGKQYI